MGATLKRWILATLFYVRYKPPMVAFLSLFVGIQISATWPHGTVWRYIGLIWLGTMGLLGSVWFASIKRIRWSYLAPLSWVVLLIGFGAVLHQRQRAKLTLPLGEDTLTACTVLLTESPTQRSDGKYRVVGRIINAPTPAGTASMGHTILLYTNYLESAPQMGDAYLVEIYKITPTEQLAHLSFRNFVLSRGASAVIWAKTLIPKQERVVRESIGIKLKLLANALRKTLLEQLQKLPSLTPKEQAIVAGMVLGDRSNLQGVDRDFRIVGVSHLLSVSGFHVGIVYLFLFYLTAPLVTTLARARLRWLLIVVGVWCFALISGLSIPTQRAVWCITIYAVAQMCNKPSNPINTIFIIATCLLLINPYTIYDLGFLLSFTGVLSILWFMPLFTPISRELQQPLLTYFWELISITLSAQFLLLPMILSYFGTIPIWLLWSNLPLSLLSTLLIPTSLLFMLLSSVGAFSFILATLSQWLSHLFAQTMEFCCLFFGETLQFTPTWWMIVFYLVGLWVGMQWFGDYQRRQESLKS